ncbi:MAG: 4a-hydroxytetrahydrobiopterin dehydratase [Bdellovibrionota bacterium]
MSHTALGEAEIARELANLREWSYTNGKLVRDLKFKDFKQALAFMNTVGAKAEAMNHHPEWTNVYNRLHIELVTHDAAPPKGAVSDLDFSLARYIEEQLPNV